MKKHLIALFILLTGKLFAQSGVIQGNIYNSINNDAIDYAKIVVIGQGKGAFSDSVGNYRIEGLTPGVYSIRASVSGFYELLIEDITVTNARVVDVDFGMQELVVEKDAVIVKAKPFRKIKESPVSLKTLNATEIERLPGANRDASKVLQALPGVASPASFRNDVIIRGGSPSENKFYLDGIEVPNINHFATQGSSGGPVGLLNVNFIKAIDFYSGAFPANYANGLSSVISFKQKEGNKEELITNIALGSSDLALTFDGPIGEKASFIFSARRSYLQLLFSALKLPFLPTYNDAQFKVDYKINRKNRISFIGLGALDDFVLNTEANDGVTDENQRELNDFFLDNIPTQDQWNYAIGVNYIHFSENSNQRFVLSRNMLKNISQKYQDNIEQPENLIFDFNSFEAENKFRFENTWRKNGYKIMTGFGYEYARYQVETFNTIIVQGAPLQINQKSSLDLHKGSLFAQATKSYFNSRLDVSLALRADMCSYSASMSNPLDQLSTAL